MRSINVYVRESISRYTDLQGCPPTETPPARPVLSRHQARACLHLSVLPWTLTNAKTSPQKRPPQRPSLDPVPKACPIVSRGLCGQGPQRRPSSWWPALTLQPCLPLEPLEPPAPTASCPLTVNTPNCQPFGLGSSLWHSGQWAQLCGRRGSDWCSRRLFAGVVPSAVTSMFVFLWFVAPCLVTWGRPAVGPLVFVYLRESH